MNGDGSFPELNRGPEALGDCPAPTTPQSSQPPTWPSATWADGDIPDDCRDALDEYLRENTAEIEDHGDGSLRVIGTLSDEQREWLLMRYVEGGLSRDGRGVVWHLKEALDA